MATTIETITDAELITRLFRSETTVATPTVESPLKDVVLYCQGVSQLNLDTDLLAEWLECHSDDGDDDPIIACCLGDIEIALEQAVQAQEHMEWIASQPTHKSYTQAVQWMEGR